MLAPALEHLVKGIVDHPDQVQVVARNSQRGDILEVRVHPHDLGRVIGRSGRTAKALRTLISALADGSRVRVDVVDTDA
ncbi:MAG: RNA-binding protein [Rhodoglobus sp.]